MRRGQVDSGRETALQSRGRFCGTSVGGTRTAGSHGFVHRLDRRIRRNVDTHMMVEDTDNCQSMICEIELTRQNNVRA
jgi:hypothetical protein